MTEKVNNLLTYCADIRRCAASYPWALFNPYVVKGHFTPIESGQYQKIFFKALLSAGFKRTTWQLVFPGQTAGLVKRIPPRPDGANEYHIRFYEDGTIDCEVEYHRFHLKHWSGTRRKNIELLQSIFNEACPDLAEETAFKIKKLFGTKTYSV